MNKKEFEILFDYVNKRIGKLQMAVAELIDNARYDINDKVTKLKFKKTMKKNKEGIK